MPTSTFQKTPKDAPVPEVTKPQAKWRIYRALQWYNIMVPNEQVAAKLLAVSVGTLRGALREESTHITLEQIKAAAGAYVLEASAGHYRSKVLALRGLLHLIDPQAIIAHEPSTFTFTKDLAVFLDKHRYMSLGAVVHKFTTPPYDFRPKYVRQAMRRLIERQPWLAERDLDGDDAYAADPITRLQRQWGS